MGELITKQDAINIVRRNLDDMLEASFLDARDYVEGKVPGLDDDDFETVSEALGAEVEGILSHLDNLCAVWNLSSGGADF